MCHAFHVKKGKKKIGYKHKNLCKTRLRESVVEGEEERGLEKLKALGIN